LPTAPALDRSQIWTLAVRMIKKLPLFGVGPQGVRMNFTAFAASDPATRASKPPPHAHNLALEMLADWGMIGGVLFAALLAVLWWPLVRRVVRGNVDSSWELAVIGAAAALLGHELVDFFLTKQAIFVIFWLLCGLAATMRASRRREHAT
jgi:O-antigen ligase